MGRRSAGRRVEELILFDVLYEDGAAHRTAKYQPRKSAASTETFPPRPISRDSTGKLRRSLENPGLRSSPSPARADAKVPRSVSLSPQIIKGYNQCKSLSETTTSMAHSAS